MKPIFFYKSYRTYLNDYYEWEKKKFKSFSYASFAKKANMASPNYLKLVIGGKRNLTISNIHYVSRALKFTSVEVEFFESLVLENQSKSLIEKKFYRNRIQTLQSNRIEESKIFMRAQPSQALEDIVNVAALLLLQNKSKKEVLVRIQKELELSSSMAEQLLSNLMLGGEVLEDQEGILKMSAKHTMMTDPKGMNLAQKKFLDDGLTESKKIFLDRYPHGSAKFLSILLTAPEGSLKDIFKDLKCRIKA